MSDLRYNRDDFNVLIGCIIEDKDYGGMSLVLEPTLDDGPTELRMMFVEDWEDWKIGQVHYNDFMDDGERCPNAGWLLSPEPFNPLDTHRIISRSRKEA